MSQFQIYIPTRTLFGAGTLKELHKQKLPGKRAMIVTTNGKSVKENGALAQTQEQLRLADADFALFDKVEANPLKSTVMAGAAFAREEGCDFVVALGGGSVMDASKAITSSFLCDIMMTSQLATLTDLLKSGILTALWQAV